jgi:hypothetical protein
MLSSPQVGHSLYDLVAGEDGQLERLLYVRSLTPTCRFMSLLPLFTGVTRGMEFSEICRFGVFQSPAYVTR